MCDTCVIVCRLQLRQDNIVYHLVYNIFDCFFSAIAFVHDDRDSLQPRLSFVFSFSQLCLIHFVHFFLLLAVLVAGGFAYFFVPFLSSFVNRFFKMSFRA